MPVIGLDARKIRDFGIGTYVRNLVRGLAQLDQENEYVLLVGPNGPEALAGLPDNFRLLPEGSTVYSVRELFALSWRLWRLKLDLYHATHYVLPLVVPCQGGGHHPRHHPPALPRVPAPRASPSSTPGG